MEIEQDQPVNTYLTDIGLLISFIKAHSNTLPEYIRVARIYLFGTPHPPHGLWLPLRNTRMHPIKAVLQQAKKNSGDREAVIDDEIDFPLQPNGDLNFHRVKLWWGVHLCAALKPYSWKVFKSRDPKTISGIAVHNLTAGVQTKMDLIMVPTERDEYKRKEQGTCAHDLKWQRRAFVDDPMWHLNRLVALCALFWLLSLVSGALSALAYTFTVVSHWTHELKLVAAAAQMPMYTPLPRVPT
ncbi:hypothetical protein BC827DRAFT_1384862 [Russula dissimulans]|nr:hypothetical protein BC827DRAFT_1384862 [Russula dissimulans]